MRRRRLAAACAQLSVLLAASTGCWAQAPCKTRSLGCTATPTACCEGLVCALNVEGTAKVCAGPPTPPTLTDASAGAPVDGNIPVTIRMRPPAGFGAGGLGIQAYELAFSSPGAQPLTITTKQLLVVFWRPTARLCGRTWTVAARAQNTAGLWSAQVASSSFDAPPCPPACKPKSSLCAQDGDCCQGAGALFCRPVVPGGAPKCVSRPNRPTIQAVFRALASSGALSAFSLRLRQPESGIFGASIEMYEVTAISADGAATLAVNSTVNTPVNITEQDPEILCGRRWNFTARALSTTSLWSEPAVYGWNPASAPPCPCKPRDAACSDNCCAGLLCVAALPGGPRTCAAQPAAPAITSAEPVAAADGTLASIAVRLQPGGDAGAANATLSVLELRATAAGAEPMELRVPAEPASRLQEPTTRLSLAGSGVQLCGREWTITARVLSSTGRWSEPAEFTFTTPPCCQPHGATPDGGDPARCCSGYVDPSSGTCAPQPCKVSFLTAAPDSTADDDVLNVAPAWTVAGVPGSGASPSCGAASLTLTSPVMAGPAACDGPFAPAIALFETGLSLSTPSQCWHYDWAFGIPTQLELRASRPLTITHIVLGYIDASQMQPPVAVTFSSPQATATASCTAVGTKCRLDAPFAMLPDAAVGSYSVSFTGTGPGIWDLQQVFAEFPPPS